jgi:radical SAM superfamily enzyme YgiQ (UPF0313 family)
MKTVILIYPKLSRDDDEGHYHWFPYSLLPLAQALAKAGFKPIVIDNRVDSQAYAKLEAHLPDALYCGISAMSGFQIIDGLKAARFVREKRPNLPLVWGGWHATILPEETLEHPLVDVVVAGRGEERAVRLADALACGSDFGSLAGVGTKTDGVVRFNGYHQPAELADDAQEYDKYIDISLYVNPARMALGYFSGHGCAFRCGFCSRHFMTNRITAHPVDNVIGDIRYYYEKYGFRHIHFHDDTMFINIDRVLDIAQRLISENLKVTWWANVRANTLYGLAEKQINLLIRSGMNAVFIGVESASPVMLKQINKGISADDIIKTNDTMKKYDVTLAVSYILGLPGDSVEHLELTVRQIERLKRDNPRVSAQTCFYQPFPGTPLYPKSLAAGYPLVKGFENWGGMAPQTVLRDIPWLSPEEMAAYRKTLQRLCAT